MSNSENSNSKKPEVSEISVFDFNEEVPGVTQLLKPNLAGLRKNPSESKPITSLKESTSSIRTPESKTGMHAPAAAASDFGSLGIAFELTFAEEQGVLRFREIKNHGNETVPAWKKSFFKKMKLDLRVLSISISFQEFASDKFPFQKEAFGMGAGEFAQCVRNPQDRKILHVFFSKKSLLPKKSEIEALLGGNSGSSDSGDSDIKIELAS